ncbi:hypothetical protein BsWGS_08130 [Bradybaena similaris]
MEFVIKSGILLALMTLLVTVPAQEIIEEYCDYSETVDLIRGNDTVVCNRTLDLVFVIDGSNSIGGSTFTDAMQKISRAVEVLVMDEGHARVGAVLYSKGVPNFLELQTDKETFQKAVSNFEYPDETTDTDMGINKAVEILKMGEATRLNNTPIAIMILTDGDASNKVNANYSALFARSRGIDVYAIGIGGQVDMAELAHYATNGSKQTFKIESYKDLGERLLNLTRLVCKCTRVVPTFIIPNTTTTPTTTTPYTGTVSTTKEEPTTSKTTPTTLETSPSTPVTSPSTPVTSPSTRETSPSTPETSPSTPETSPTILQTASTSSETPPKSTTTARTEKSTPGPTKDPSEDDADTYTELCKNSLTVGGVGYVLHPDDCTKVLQCYYNPNTNKTLVVARQCPSGQFWDQTCLKCLDSWKVDCPYDKCKTNSCSNGCPTLDTYPMNGVCGGFWSCQNGRSYPKCCPPCYSYLAGYGCKFGTTCFDKCGPQEDCAEGLGVCEKIPIWDNSTVYAMATDTVGLLETTCLHSDFSIVGCKCHLKFMDIFMQDSQECQPYHELNSTFECSGKPESVPIKQKSSAGNLAFRINLKLAEPQFDIISTPTSSQCDNPAKLRIWADSEGIHASLRDITRGGVLTTVLLQNVTGHIEILVMLRQGLLTLAVSRDKVQYVSTIRASSNALCTDCIHNFSVSSTSEDDCLVNKVAIYNCQPEVTNIYMRS